MTSTDLSTTGSTARGTSWEALGQVSGYLAAVAESSLSTLPSSSSRLSPRATAVLVIVRRFRLISAAQIHRLAFYNGSPESTGRRMRRTMKRLLDLGLVKRLPRPVGGWGAGSEGYIYQGSNGGFRSAEPHVLAVTEVFVQLVCAERLQALQIIACDPEPYCHTQIGHLELKPDAFLDIRTAQGRFRYWLEIDLSSERRPQLNKKMSAYCKAYEKWSAYHYQGADKTFPKIVFIVLDKSRIEMVESVVRRQELPSLFEVVTFSEAIPYLIGE